MVYIEKLINYTIPLYGNERILPYGTLRVYDDIIGNRKDVQIKEEGSKQYFTFNRKRYYVRNIGTLHFPKFEIVEN